MKIIFSIVIYNFNTNYHVTGFSISSYVSCALILSQMQTLDILKIFSFYP